MTVEIEPTAHYRQNVTLTLPDVTAGEISELGRWLRRHRFIEGQTLINHAHKVVGTKPKLLDMWPTGDAYDNET